MHIFTSTRLPSIIHKTRFLSVPETKHAGPRFFLAQGRAGDRGAPRRPAERRRSRSGRAAPRSGGRGTAGAQGSGRRGRAEERGGAGSASGGAGRSAAALRGGVLPPVGSAVAAYRRIIRR